MKPIVAMVGIHYMNQDLREVFKGIKEVTNKMKLDEIYATHLRAISQQCIAMITNESHASMLSTFDFIKSKGLDDSETVFVFTLVCGSVGKIGPSKPKFIE